MEDLDKASSHEIKNLLGLWIDPQQEAYVFQKDRLKQGISLKVQIPNKYLSLIFAEHSTKTIANSLIPKFFSKMICIWDIKSKVLRQSLNEFKLILFKNDLLNLTIQTKFGTVDLSKITITSEILQDQISQIIQPSKSDLELFSEITLTLKLVEEGDFRYSLENENLIYNSNQWAKVVRDNMVSIFKKEWAMMAKALLLRRLEYFNVTDPEDIPQSFEVFGSKNLYVYNLFSIEMSTKTSWFHTNSDCLLAAQKDYQKYITNCNIFQKLLENNCLDLGSYAI